MFFAEIPLHAYQANKLPFSTLQPATKVVLSLFNSSTILHSSHFTDTTERLSRSLTRNFLRRKKTPTIHGPQNKLEVGDARGKVRNTGHSNLIDRYGKLWKISSMFLLEQKTNVNTYYSTSSCPSGYYGNLCSPIR